MQVRLLDEPIAVLGLSVRTLNILENDGCRKDVHGHVIHLLLLRDLLSTPPECISSLPGMGAKTFQGILASLARLGFDSRVFTARKAVVHVEISHPVQEAPVLQKIVINPGVQDAGIVPKNRRERSSRKQRR